MRFLSTAVCALFAAVSVSGCSQGDGPHPTEAGPTGTSGGGTTGPSGGPPAIELEPFLEGLERPTFLTHASDGSGTIYVVEQVGRIKAVKNGAIGTTVLDMTGRVGTANEEGLLGLAFPPDFESSKRIYIYYTDPAGDNNVATAVVGGNGQAGATSAILRLSHPIYSNHNGGMITFGPDGQLWIGTGDGGSGGDPNRNGQNKNTLLGKLLRITPAPSSSCLTKCYTTPSDNPYSLPNGAPEVWDYGLRNPWRFSFDRATGDLWIGDVGQGNWEEVNVERAGARGGTNWGWNCREGAHAYTPAACTATGAIDPVAEYDHGGGKCSLTGGYVYRGPEAALRGWYFFADYCSGEIWVLDSSKPGSGVKRVLDTDLNPSSFGEDEAGNLYVLDHQGGAVLKLVAA